MSRNNGRLTRHGASERYRDDRENEEQQVQKLNSTRRQLRSQFR
jgi:hypothetical protein